MASDKVYNQAASAAVTATYDTGLPDITSLSVTTQTASSFVVAWSGEDNLSGIAYYDAQYQIDEGAWTDWLTRTLATQNTFSGESGHVYGFRVHAVDRAGNESWRASVGKAGVKKYYLAAGRRVATRALAPSAAQVQVCGSRTWYTICTGIILRSGQALGSTSLVTNGAGEVVAQQLYTPYGSPRPALSEAEGWITGTLPTDLTYTGQRQRRDGVNVFPGEILQQLAGTLCQRGYDCAGCGRWSRWWRGDVGL